MFMSGQTYLRWFDDSYLNTRFYIELSLGYLVHLRLTSDLRQNLKYWVLIDVKPILTNKPIVERLSDACPRLARHELQREASDLHDLHDP